MIDGIASDVTKGDGSAACRFGGKHHSSLGPFASRELDGINGPCLPKTQAFVSGAMGVAINTEALA